MRATHKAAINIGINFLAVGLGFMLGAAEPQNRWQWIQFVSGASLALIGAYRNMSGENLQSAAAIDKKAEG